MAETNKIFNYLSLTGLQKYDANIKGFIEDKVTAGVANSFKFVNLVDGELRFYTVNPISEDTVADYAIELPEQDLSHLMQLVKDATAGNVAVFGENGQVVDTGIKAADLATKSEVETAKGEVQASVDELAELVGELPEGTSATSVVDYVNIKTAGIATDAALEELNNQVSGLQGAVQAIQEDYLVEADKTELAGQIGEVGAKADKNAAAIKAIADDYLKASDKKALQDQIDANESAIELLTNGVSAEEVDGVNDLIQYVKDHGAEVTGMKKDISDNTAAIDAEKEAREAADNELDGKITALGTQVAADIATAKGEAIADAAEKANKALEDAKAHADAEVAKDRTRLDALEAADEGFETRVKANEDAITAINNAETGILKQAKDYADEKIGEEVEARNGAITTAKGEAIEAAGLAADAKVKALEEGQVAINKADIANLAKAHGEDKAELQGGIDEVGQAVADLEASLVEITTAQIEDMFKTE